MLQIIFLFLFLEVKNRNEPIAIKIAKALISDKKQEKWDEKVT